MWIRTNKLWIVVAAGVVVTSVGIGTAWSYLKTAHAQLGQTIRDAVPIAFELKRLEQMTTDLIPEMRANQKVAAQLDVEIEYLAREIETMRNAQKDGKAQMQKLRQALAEKKNSYEFGGRTFSRQEVEQDLERRLQPYDNTAVQLAAKEQILKARRQTLAAATDRIKQYQQQHDLLVQKAESLQGRAEVGRIGRRDRQLPVQPRQAQRGQATCRGSGKADPHHAEAGRRGAAGLWRDSRRGRQPPGRGAV